MKTTIKVKIVAIQQGTYKNIVVENLNYTEELYHYITVTECPNWKEPIKLTVGNVGFLTFEPVNEGDSYINHETGEQAFYKYDAIYYMNFVPEVQMVTETKEFKF